MQGYTLKRSSSRKLQEIPWLTNTQSARECTINARCNPTSNALINSTVTTHFSGTWCSGTLIANNDNDIFVLGGIHSQRDGQRGDLHRVRAPQRAV